MSLEHVIYLLVFVLWMLSAVQCWKAVRRGHHFFTYIKQSVDQEKTLRSSQGQFFYQPKAVIILPCCGIDEKLHRTIQALSVQQYDDYQVLFTFESMQDPAYSAVGRWTAEWTNQKAQRVVAGLADHRGQKIHNLLAAIDVVPDDREVLLFLDSDVVPNTDWIGHMVAPLKDDRIGATTGYRWYAAGGGLAAGVRCAWNAATVSLLADEQQNFCWGGSTAIRRDRFDTLHIASYWESALSDDLQLTRAVREAGLQIRFIPQAMMISDDRTTLRSFWKFASRQVIITRICGHRVWRAGLIYCAQSVAGGAAAALLFGVGLLGWFGTRWAMYAALAGWITVILLVVAMSILRQLGLRRVLKAPNLTGRDFLWDVLGTLFIAGSLHLNLVFSTLTQRRFIWRNIEYELLSADQTRIIRHIDNSS